MLSGCLSLPMKDTIFAALAEISSQPIFSRRIMSASFECAVDGNIGAPVGPNPRIWVKGHRYCPSYGSHPLTNLHAYTGRSPTLNLVFVTEQANTSTASSIVQRPPGEDTQCGGLPTVYITHHSTAYLRG